MNNLSSQPEISDKPCFQVILQRHIPVTFKGVHNTKLKEWENSSQLKETKNALQSNTTFDPIWSFITRPVLLGMLATLEWGPRD